MKKKRPIGSPTGSTPGKPSTKVAREELIGLIQYHSWPTHEKESFWNACAASGSQYSGQPLRSGKNNLLYKFILENV